MSTKWAVAGLDGSRVRLRWQGKRLAALQMHDRDVQGFRRFALFATKSQRQTYEAINNCDFKRHNILQLQQSFQSLCLSEHMSA